MLSKAWYKFELIQKYLQIKTRNRQKFTKPVVLWQFKKTAIIDQKPHRASHEKQQANSKIDQPATQNQTHKTQTPIQSRRIILDAIESHPRAALCAGIPVCDGPQMAFRFCLALYEIGGGN